MFLIQSWQIDNIKASIEVGLEKLKKKKVILNYKVYINDEFKRKTGVPSGKTYYDNIYLYDGNNNPFFLNTEVSLVPHIEAVKKNMSWINVYYIPGEENKEVI